MSTKVKKMSRGIRLEQHGCVLSETLYRPGATHSIFDILAAAVAIFAPGPQVAMLGFAGGGMMGPLRKLGAEHAVQAVDLEEEGYEIYRSVAGRWGGELEFSHEDAVAWLRGQRRKFDAIVEDLSVPVKADVVKPEVSWTTLPKLMKRRLKKGGVAITNLVPVPRMAWQELERSCRVGPGVTVTLEDYCNHVLIQGCEVGGAREAGAELREALRGMRSRAARAIKVRQLPETWED